MLEDFNFISAHVACCHGGVGMESRDGVVVVEEALVDVEEQAHRGGQVQQRANHVQQDLLKKVRRNG